MYSIETITTLNQNAQSQHFKAAYKRAMINFPDGFTMDAYGNIVRRTSGFVVAGITYCNLEELVVAGFRTIYGTVLDVSEIEWCFGYWKEAGHEYFEISYIFEEEFDAKEFARNFQQKAIYDFAAGKSIYLEVNAKLEQAAKQIDARTKSFTYVGSVIARTGNV
jgi:hypothetical protein